MDSASDAEETWLSEQGVSTKPPRSQLRRFAAVSGLSIAIVAAILALVHSRTPAPETIGRPSAATVLAEEASCVSYGVNCLESQCCISGGKKGLQCYEKNKDWGECFDVGNCTPGVHDGEKEGIWDASGTFQLLKWSCKEKGKTSKPACWSYSSSKCPSDRCEVIKKKCEAKCSTFAEAGGCWGAGNCMWTDDKCKDGCWLVEGKDDCKAKSRCQWLEAGNSSSCGLACHVHGGEEDCKAAAKDKCMWDGNGCVDDPCSAPGEDCTKTKCCSMSRGALGMKCVEKMEYWATCMDFFNKTAMKDWSGKILGPRAFEVGTRPTEEERKWPKMDAGCNWAGEECSDTKTCCNKGFSCNKKDDTFAGCVQTMTVSTWGGQPVALPDGWDGELKGGGRDEYQVDATPEGKDMAGTSFYCFMAVVPDSPEIQLLWKAKENGGSIFGCNATSVYKAWQTNMAGWDTGSSGASVVNTAVFLKVMDYVKEDGLYLKYDWTIKVDADCVFLPDRLRSHLWALRPPANVPIYVKNNNLQGLGNAGFLGAIEVFSREAMKKFMDNKEDCGKFLGVDSGEDGFFKSCMDGIGVGFIWDQNMFKPNYDPATCTNGMYAAYHPIKYPSHWQRCWDIATGKMCQGLTYDCGGDLDPPVTSAGVR